MNYFSKNILHLRDKLSLNQSQFAEKLGVTRGQINAWENEKSKPRFDDLIEIANYFSLQIDDLVKKDLSAPDAFKKAKANYEPLHQEIKDVGNMYATLERYTTALEQMIRDHCPALKDILNL